MKINISVEIEDTDTVGMGLYDILQNFSPANAKEICELGLDEQIVYSDRVFIFRTE